jgi:predicted secreted protein
MRDVLDTAQGRECCRKLSVFVADQIQEFLKNGFKVLAVLGGDVNSPGCAVHVSDENGYELVEGSGVFMMELYSELSKRNIKIPFRGVRDSDPRKLVEDVDWLDRLLATS